MLYLWPWQMIRPLCTFLDVVQNLLLNAAYVMPHCAKFVHIVQPYDKGVIMSNMLHISLCLPTLPQNHLPRVIDWPPTTGLIPGPAHEPWYSLSRQKPEEKVLAQEC